MKKTPKTPKTPKPPPAAGAPRPPSGGELKTLARSQIAPSPLNPRRDFPEAALEELAESIRAQGVVQPLVVRPRPHWELTEPDLARSTWGIQITGLPASWQDAGPGELGETLARRWLQERNAEPYELVCGERRWRAAGRVAAEYPLPCLVRDLPDAQVLEMMLVENAQRAGLDPFEEAAAYQRLLDEGICPRKEDVALKIGRSRSHVYQRLALLTLSASAKAAYQAGAIDVSVAELVSRIPGAADQQAALKAVAAGARVPTAVPGDEYAGEAEREPMSYRHAKHLVFARYLLQLKKAPFDVQAAALTPAGPCGPCPKRTGNAPDLWPDVADPNVCTDRACWAAKVAAHAHTQLAALARKQVEILPADQTRDLFQYGSLRWNAPQVEAGGVCPQDPQRRTYRQLAQAAGVPLQAAAEPDTGKVHTLVDTRALYQARPELNPKAGRPTPEPAQAARDRRIDAETRWAVGRARHALALAAPWGQPEDTRLLRLIAADYQNQCHDPRAVRPEAEDEVNDLDLERLTDRELRAYVVAQLIDNAYDQRDAVTRWFPVAEKALRKEVAARIKAEAAAPKPPPPARPPKQSQQK